MKYSGKGDLDTIRLFQIGACHATHGGATMLVKIPRSNFQINIRADICDLLNPMRRILVTIITLLFAAAPALARASFVPAETTLRDDMTYTIHWDGSYDYEETVAVRLNTAEAVQDDGEAYIGYRGALDTVKILAAYTRATDGRRIDVAPGQMLDQQSDESDNESFSDEKNKVLIFPDLSPGAVEYYHYVINTSAPDFPGQFDAVQNFTDDSAIEESSVTVIASSGLKLYFEADGLQGGKVASPGPGQDEFVYRLSPQPARAPEDGSVGIDDVSPRLAISSFPDAASVGAAYEARAADKAQVTLNVQVLANRITKGITDPRARAVALYDWVSRHIRYVSIDFGDGGYVPNTADSIIANGYGDCKDHVTLLKALLAAVEIPSSGALVNWSNEYWAPSIALPDYNHIITYIPQFNVFVDSTAEFAPFGVLPALERGKQALITGAPGIPSRLVTLPLTSGPVPDIARVVTTARLGDDGTVSGGSVVTDSGRQEETDREAFAGIGPGTAGGEAARLMERYNVQGSGDMRANDPNDLSKQFGYDTNFVLPGYAAMPGPGTMPLPPGVPSFNALAGLTRDTALPARTLPVPCAAENTEEVTHLALPPGIRVKSLPAATHFGNAMGRYDAVYALRGNTVTADRHLLLNPPGPTCDPAQYQLMRAIGFAIGRDMRGTISY
jgi:transglutaminase-like putative cysteine protease